MVRNFEAIRIKLAAPDEIMSWSFGEVTKAETINYRTFRAEVGGLMDESIFGPTKDYECFCGKYKKVRYKGIVCDRCGVEVTTKRVRRERMGHISLVSPVTHVWFSHGVPNKLAAILDIPQKKLETVIYYARYIVTEVDQTGKQDAAGRIESLKKEETERLDQELNQKLEALEGQYAEKETVIKKEFKDADKQGVQIERNQASLRKEAALVKSAFNQKRSNLDERFSNLEDLVDSIEIGFTLSEEDHRMLEEYDMTFYEAGMGAEAVKILLERLDLAKTITELDTQIATTKSEAIKTKALKRKKILAGMHRADVRPEWIVIDVLPVLPPDLRPIIQLPGGRFATSDYNDLYRRVINRNNRLKRLMDLGAPEVILRNEKRMLQEAVDALIDNSHRPGSPTLNSRQLPYKSLSDMLRGKQGRFRQNLLGKRVDYSGRAVIVPGPELRYDQCGLPKNIALELFKPFIVRELIARGVSSNPAAARRMFEEKPAVIWDILEEVSKNRPVLLNRAPTLHKQSIVAFYPILIEGNSIKLHPMMCKGFNADFDGDQMAVHLPLSNQAMNEAKARMFAPNNMLSMASSDPIMNTEKDMALGIYMLTLMDADASIIGVDKVFANPQEAITRYDLGQVRLYEPVKLVMNTEMITTTVGRIIFNAEMPEGYGFINETLGKKKISQISADIFNKYGREVAIQVLDRIKDMGFFYATKSGFSISFEEFDFGAEEKVQARLTEFRKTEDQLLEDYDEGLLTTNELLRRSREEWSEAYEGKGGIWDMVWDNAKDAMTNINHLDRSGATPVSAWVKAISGVKGTVTDADGKMVDLPLMGNYYKGLTNFEYFVSAKATRKNYTDVALRTADSGYLTRRLVDIAQDVLVREDDCGTIEGAYLDRADKRVQNFGDRVRGRYLAEDVADPKTGEIVAHRNDIITVELAEKISSNVDIAGIKVRSPITCRTKHGICTHCYGYDLGTREIVKLGEAVGIIAAQAIGEPSTQLTLKNKSDARATGDITQGLPRVEELFEVRTPKAKALIADIPGTVKIVENEDSLTLRISATKKMRKTYNISGTDNVVVKKGQVVNPGDVLFVSGEGKDTKTDYQGKVEMAGEQLFVLIDRELESEMDVENRINLMVKDGDVVEVGQQLTYGSIDPKELSTFVNIHAGQQYIISEIQAVYSIYGIAVDDLHIEIIVARMARFGQVTKEGGSDLLVGESIDMLTLEEINEELRTGTKDPVEYEQVLLGLTHAALRTESFLSAASFEQQVRVLSDAALIGKVDNLRGLKENVIIGRLLPIGDLYQKVLSGEVNRMELMMTA
jgi:DNA-directed RNA polymerase subunit beta'